MYICIIEPAERHPGDPDPQTICFRRYKENIAKTQQENTKKNSVEKHL